MLGIITEKTMMSDECCWKSLTTNHQRLAGFWLEEVKPAVPHLLPSLCHAHEHTQDRGMSIDHC